MPLPARETDTVTTQTANTPPVPARGGAPAQAARRMRDEILALPDGAPLGSEEELLARYGLSRPTLRQTARILEQEQLLVVRRGNGGGYYGRRPDIGAVTQAAALYLRLRQTTVRDVLDAFQLVNVEAARLAALTDTMSADAKGGADATGARLDLAEFRQHLVDRKDATYLAADVVRDEVALYAILMRMAGNPALELFHRTLFEFGQRDANLRVFQGHPERCAHWRTGRLRMVDAILARDPEMAVLLARRQNRLMLDWVSPEVERESIAPRD
ncbi:GntR family transcriptional regulator [Nitrospirillum sp. BR 11164]|uniref:FadR/GntR family transcriptional regulator n=1 Tax=Nitrospirillum sp. BR 11164 TaxID=3104324 RepID=UPI002B0004CF|nr:GntR family transcriptional regulator [Nitrospirillum sp. BR 11164]MEA1648396.1 GntR family transcriptional regulator [Nitrospirillum sp. BR 11164]